MTHWREHIARSGRACVPGEPWAKRAFFIILLLAAVLRFWDLPHLPYTHDEISALVRLYPTLGETIQRGVIELDTHPPGVQVFEWLWTRVFTMEEADVKLPFILMDLLALWLLYRFAQAWTGNAPALILTSLMAVLQYSVLYGQIARPYAAGLFTTALLADQLTRFAAFGDRRMLAGAGIAAVLSAYTHHFALMLAALMLGTFLFMLKKEQRRAYLIMCVVVLALYLPNIPIFLKQLGLGGLSEWLPAPDADWLPRYAWFIANNSVALAVMMIALTGASLWLLVRKRSLRSPIVPVLLLWGSIPLVIGYAYSLWRAPVLQYSVVLFSFPYLVLLAVQGLLHWGKRYALVTCTLLCAMGVQSLVHLRKHYVLFYHSKYEAMLHAGIDAQKANGQANTLVLCDAPDHVLRFYLDLWHAGDDQLRYIQLKDRFIAGTLDSLLTASTASEVVYGFTNGAAPEQLAAIQQRFPFLVDRKDLVDGQVVRFSRTSQAAQRFDRDTVASLAPNKARIGPWDLAGDMVVLRDSTGAETGWDYAQREFGIGIKLQLDSITTDPRDVVEVVAEVDDWKDLENARLVADVRMKTGNGTDSTVYYRSGFLDPRSRQQSRASMVVSLVRADIRTSGPLEMLAYIYSPEKGQLHVRSMTVLVRQGDPVRYGTLDPVDWLGRFPVKTGE